MYYEFSPNPMVFLIQRTENNDHIYHAETLPALIQQAHKWLIIAKPDADFNTIRETAKLQLNLVKNS